MLKLRYNNYLSSLLIFMGYLSIFNKPISGILKTSAIGYIDEVILVIGVILISLIMLLSKKIHVIFLLVAGFFIYSVVISLSFGLNRDWIDILIQSLVNLKFFLLTLTFLMVFRDRVEVIERFFRNVLLLAIIGLVLNVIFGSSFNHLFDMPVYNRPSVALRYGGFLNPNHLAFLMALYIGTLLSKARTSGSFISAKQWGLIVGSLFVIALTDSRTAIIGVFIFFAAFYWEFILKNVKIFMSFLFLIAFSVVMLLLFSDILEITLINLQGSFSLDSYYIRGIMINMAVQISYFYFPIGTGAASFGSLLSDGSKVYEDFGVADRLFFIEKRGIYDSSVASVLGEYGIIGIVLYGLMFYYLYRYLKTLFPARQQTMTKALFIAFVFYSVTNPTLTNNLYILISIPVFVIFSVSQNKKTITSPQGLQ